jgi:hypothetical protein
VLRDGGCFRAGRRRPRGSFLEPVTLLLIVQFFFLLRHINSRWAG